MALTKLSVPGISTGGDYQVDTLTSTGTVQIGSATTVHTTGIDLGSGNITGHNLFSTGIITAVSFVGDISQATGAAAGLVSALSQDQSNPLNKVYYTDTVLSIGSTQTVNPPDSSNVAYTQYAEIAVEEGFDLIVEDGDDLVPDILGLSTETAGVLAGAGGRVRADQFTNKAGTGAPTFPSGVNVTGVATATTFSGNLTGNVTGNLTGDVTGNLTGDVTGNVTGSAINVTGVITATSFSGDGSALTGIDATSLKDSGDTIRVQANTSGAVVTGVLTATSFEGDGSNLTGIDSTALVDSDGTTRVQANGSGAVVTGILTATSFSGSGANLTSIPDGIVTSAKIVDNSTSFDLNRKRLLLPRGHYVYGSDDPVPSGTNLNGHPYGEGFSWSGYYTISGHVANGATVTARNINNSPNGIIIIELSRADAAGGPYGNWVSGHEIWSVNTAHHGFTGGGATLIQSTGTLHGSYTTSSWYGIYITGSTGGTYYRVTFIN